MIRYYKKIINIKRNKFLELLNIESFDNFSIERYRSESIFYHYSEDRMVETHITLDGVFKTICNYDLSFKKYSYLEDIKIEFKKKSIWRKIKENFFEKDIYYKNEIVNFKLILIKVIAK